VRGAAVAGVTALTASFAAIAVPATAGAVSNVTVTARIAGTDRFGTAADLAEAAFPGGAQTVILAYAYNFPDALAGNYLAGQQPGGAPILLADTHLPVSSETMSALQALKAKNIIILGGVGAIGGEVQSVLTSAGYNVSRIGGVARDDTAQQINTMSGLTVGTFGGNKTAFLSRDDEFPDALGAGPVAFAKGYPIILTPPGSLSTEAQQTIQTLGIKQLLVLGGTNAISTATGQAADAAEGSGAAPDVPLGGVNRADTSRLVAEWAIKNAGLGNARFAVASGDPSFGGADALASGPYAGTIKIPLLVTNSVTDPGSGAQGIPGFETDTPTATAAVPIGGTNPLPDSTLALIGNVTSSTGCTGMPLTSLLQLCSASIVSTTTPAQANASNAAGTVIQYVFTTALTGASINAGGFKAYPADDGVPAGYAGTSVCGVTSSACPASSNPNAVSILFAQTALQGTTGADSAATLTLAAVANTPTAAVTLTSGAINPDGVVGIGTSSSAIPAGTTTAPDVLFVPATRSAAAAASTAIDLTFDKPAFPQGTDNNTTEYEIVYGATAPGASGTEAACTGPGATNPNGPAGTGLTQPGYNTSTSSVTIVCPNASGASPTTLPKSEIDRVVVLPGAVATAATGGIANSDIQATESTFTSAPPTPSLHGLTFTSGGGTTDDIATFTFDVGVANVTPSSFKLIPQNAATPLVAGTGAAGSCTTTAPTSPGCEVSSTASSTFVALYFAPGTLSADGIVAGQVAAGAVQNSSGAVANFADELASGNGASSGQTPGAIAAPQLKSAAVATSTNGPGSTATLTFDAPILADAAAGAVGLAGIHFYDADGTELNCTNAAAPTTANTTVTCSAFNQAGGTAATQSQLAGIVWATADATTVIGNVAATPAAPNANPNPEGAVGA
jgi:putative cell wall-binding protein